MSLDGIDNFFFDPPKRDDEADARHWRGPLFLGRSTPPLMWYENGAYEMIKHPKSVTFPICAFCRHIIWNNPHFEELITDQWICDTCFKEEEAAEA